MELTPAETCRKVADIVDYDNERFNMGAWQINEPDCGTIACIAGHTALLHGDPMLSFAPEAEWIERQGRRLGLTPPAASAMFNPMSELWVWMIGDPRGDICFSLVLRRLEKEMAASKRLVGRKKLKRLAEEALA